METIALPHLSQYSLHICLFTDVENAAYLRQQLLDGNTDFEYALLDASTLLSRTHILAACFWALNDKVNDRLKSRNIHSEIVFALSPNNNITQAFRQFGISNESRNLVVVKIGGERELIEAHLMQHVQGVLKSATDDHLAGISDVARTRKIYRIGVSKDDRLDTEQARREAETFVLGSMALKGS